MRVDSHHLLPNHRIFHYVFYRVASNRIQDDRRVPVNIQLRDPANARFIPAPPYLFRLDRLSA